MPAVASLGGWYPPAPPAPATPVGSSLYRLCSIAYAPPIAWKNCCELQGVVVGGGERGEGES